MVVEYNKKYDEDIKDLLVELQQHLVDLDVEKYNKITLEYREKYFSKVMEDVAKCEGKVFLYIKEDKAVGFISAVINNEAQDDYDFTAPKRGRITELVVSKKERSQGIGDVLITQMENYLYSVGCKDILLAVFAYNERAYEFYKRHEYHPRMYTMTKTLNNKKD